VKGRIIDALKILVPLGIGVFVIWYQYSKLSEQQVSEITTSFRNANYFWVLMSVMFGLLSHLSRAYRWKYPMEPLGYKTRFVNNFLGVMIGYVANIILPRFGEVWRCVMVSRYEKDTSFEKLFGTVVAERVADMIVLLLIIATVILIQLDQLKEMVTDLISNYSETHSPTDTAIKLAVLVVIGTIGLVVGRKILMRSSNPLLIKVRGLVNGLIDGVMSILKMKRKWAFIAHTAFIWGMYLAMYYVPFLALPETSSASVSAVLASFVMASFSIVLVQGGIGVYPVAVAQTLLLYDIPYEAGFAMGWIIWVAQTLMIVTFGVASLLLMPLVNSKTIERPN